MRGERISPFRRLAAWTCTLAVGVQILAPFSAVAAPGIFTVASAGISRSPLDALQFNVPGFGELTEAVNIASGNVYMAFAGVSHNNLLKAKDEQQAKTLSGSGWNILPRQRLDGFNPATPVASYPSTLSIFNGDGSRDTYTLVSQIPATAPHWIQRYKTAGTASRIYLLNGESGKAYRSAWIVLTTAAQTVAHAYAADGTRSTFSADGEYADFVQNLSQQYRSAGAGDPYGTGAASPKTQLTYRDTTQGFLSTIRDEWGRLTRYTWDPAAQVVDTIESAFPDTTGTGAPGRIISLGYKLDRPGGTQRLLEKVTFRAGDGLSNPASPTYLDRIITFDYNLMAIDGITRPLLSKVVKPAAGSEGKLITISYGYDSAGRVISYSSLDSLGKKTEPDTSYTYTPLTESATAVAVSADADGSVGGSSVYPGNSLTGTYKAGLFANGQYTNFTAPRAGTFDLRLNAFATEYQGWPRVAVSVNGAAFAEYDIDQATPKDFTLGSLVVQQGDVVQVKLINDLCCGPAAASSNHALDDRNVYLNSLTFIPTFASAANLVTVSQDTKKQLYYFDAQGQLTADFQRDQTPNGGADADRMLYHRYRYYPNGNVGLITEGYQVGNVFHDGKTVHLAYDQAGNQVRQAEYETPQKFDGTISVPMAVTVGGFQSDGTQPGHEGIVQRGKTFSLTATVTGDPNRKGVQWLIDGAVPAPVPVEGSCKPQSGSVMLCGEPLISLSENDTYTVTQTFATGQAGADQNLTLVASSRADSRVKAKSAVTVASPVEKIGLSLIGDTTVDNPPLERIIVAPDCMRRLRTDKADASPWLDLGCQRSIKIYPVLKFFSWARNPTVPSGFGMPLALDGNTVNATLTAGPVNAATSMPAYYSLTVPWLSSVLGTDKTERVLNVKATVGSVTANLALNLGFFSIRMTPSGHGAWNDFGDEYSSYYYTVEVANSPNSTLSLLWSATSSTIRGDGCIQYGSSGGWMQGRSYSTITASVNRYPEMQLSKTVTQYTKFTSADTGDRCIGLATYPGGLEPGKGFANTIGAAPLTGQSGFPGKPGQDIVTASTAQAPAQPGAAGTSQVVNQILSSDLQPGYTHYETVEYDASNRPTLKTKVAPAALNAGGLLHQYKNVTDTITYTSYPPVTTAGQTFELPGEVKTVHAIGGLTQSTTTDNYSTAGLLTSRVDRWGTGGTEYRQFNFVYWKDMPTATASYGAPKLNAGVYQPGTLNEFIVTQFGDQVAIMDRSGPRTPAWTNGRSFRYDQFGHVVYEAQDGSAVNLTSDAAGTVSATLGDDAVARVYNGYDNQIWESRRLGFGNVREEGWTYDAAGAVINSWQGTPSRLTTFTYNEAGVLISQQSGIGNGRADRDAVLTTTRDTVSFTPDDFGRPKEIKTQRTGTQAFDTTRQAYDTLDRVVQKILPDGSTLSTWYDALGQQRRTEEPYGTRTWTRNTLGWLLTESRNPASGPSLTTTYTHDAYGRILVAESDDASIGSQNGDRQTVYRYDSEGRETLRLEPVMRSVADSSGTRRWLTDSRRPSTISEYDELGRLVTVKTGLYGTTISGTNDTDTATTTYGYDEFDRLISTVNPTGYTTKFTSDGMNRVYKTERQIWKGGESAEGAKLGVVAGQYATTWTLALDRDRPLITIDPTGARTEQQYNRAGDPTVALVQQPGGQMGVRKAVTYTGDGLPLSTWEPNPDGSSAPAAFNEASPESGFVATTTHTYTTGRQPATTQKPVNDGQTATTAYTYAWNGLPSKVTPPEGLAVTNEYDYQGNLTKSTDTNGFTTVTTYNLDGERLTVKQSGRTDATTGEANAVDASAALTAGLASAYAYDAYGNLTRRNERGLITDYVYNSKGQVIAESRPTYHETPPAYPAAALYKYFAYRLDGALMAETTYTYEDGGTLQSAQTTSGGLTSSSVSSSQQTSGAITVTRSDPAGRVTQVTRLGYPINGTQTARVTESSATYVNNGLGFRVLRDFTGDRSVAANVRDPETGGFLTSSGLPVTTYRTYWKYNGRGDLTDQWNEVGTPTNTAAKFDVFSYTYSPTGKRLTATRDVQVRLLKEPSGARLSTNPLVAASVGRIESDYNARDLLKTTRVYDQSPTTVSALEAAPTSPQRTTSFTYYPDGSRKTESTSTGSKTTTYDLNGRVQSVVDSNGTNVPRYTPEDEVSDGAGNSKVSRKVGTGPATITYSYSAGKTSVQTAWASGCSISQSTVVTVGGLTQQETETDSCDPERATTTRTYVYSGRGLPTSEATLIKGTYDAGGNTNPARPDLTHRVNVKAIDYKPDNSVARRVIETTSTQGEYTYQATQPGGYVCDPAEPGQGTPVGDGTWVTNCRQEPSTTITQTMPAYTRSSQVTEQQTFTADGYLTREQVTSTNTQDSKDVSYTLDGQGNRLSVKGGSYDGYIKRYDAEGRAAMFYRYDQYQMRGAYSDFRYDPDGLEVLTSDAAFMHDGKGYMLSRNQSATYSADGEVQVIRKREGRQGDRTGTYFLWWRVSGGPHDSYQSNDLIRDVTYSMADGLGDITKWNAVLLFDQPGTPSTVAFEAPTASVAVTTGLDPATTRMPGQATPPTTTAPGTEVTPPSSPAEPSKPTSTTGDEAPGASIGSGQDAGTIASVGTLAVTGDAAPQDKPADQAQPAASAAANPAEPQGAQATSKVDLQSPQNVLPASVQAISTQDTTVPGAQQEAATPTLSENGEVRQPGQSPAPSPLVDPARPDVAQSPLGGTVVPPLVAGEERVRPPLTSAAGGHVYLSEIYLTYAEYTSMLLTYAGTLTDEYEQASEERRRQLSQDLDRVYNEVNRVILAKAATTAWAKIDPGLATLRGALHDAAGLAPVDQLRFQLALANAVVADRITLGAIQGLQDIHRAIAACNDGKSQSCAYKDNSWQLGPMNFVDSSTPLAKINNWMKYVLPTLDSGWIKQEVGQFVIGMALGWGTGKLIGRLAPGAVAALERRIGIACLPILNSFSASTMVRTITGLAAISTLTVGTEVLAFNEELGENGYYPVTAIHKNIDPEITYLSIVDPDLERDSEPEVVETTPEHPFYVMESAHSAAQPRPKPEGHDELGENWIGAGHLKIGDKIRQADGTIGVVVDVVNIRKTEEMFNLTVADAHTYYVGTHGWLVHNTGGPMGCRRAVHILYGDNNPLQIPGLGGHLYPGGAGKTPFPSTWNEKTILDNVTDVVTSPSTQWYAQSGPGGAAATAMYTNSGNPANWVAWETRNGVLMRIVFQPATGRVVTAFPETNPIPASILAKPIR